MNFENGHAYFMDSYAPRVKRFIMRICAEIQRTLQNVEWPTLIGLFGFLTLTYMSVTQRHPYFAAAILLIGVLFVVLAAYNSYRHKSIELVDRYERRFFCQNETAKED